MTWLAPWALGAGGLGVLGVVLAHLLARQRPRAIALATARFLPAGVLEATTVQRTPRDRWWMALRALIVALIACGAAQPVVTGARVPVRTVLLLDRTLPAAEQRRVLATLTPSDAVIAFDTNAVIAPPQSVDVREVTADASFSAALALLARTRDSLSLNTRTLRVAVASRFGARTLDPASALLRAEIPESIVVMPVTAAMRAPITRGAVVVAGADRDDAVAATLVLLGDSVAATGARIQRGSALTAADSAAASGGATVIWWPASRAADTTALHSVTIGSTTWVGVFARDSAAAAISGERTVGWWTGGSPAVWRSTIGAGCVLRTAIALPERGDQTLSLSAQRWLAALLRHCEPAADGVAPAWLSAAPLGRRTARALPLRSALAPWLYGAALLLAVTELLLRPGRLS